MAVINTVTNLFDCQIKGCLFHYSQAILRNLNLILGKGNYKDKKLHQLVRRTASLPFVQEEKVDEVWEEIMNEIDRNYPLIIKFLDCMTENWIEHRVFKKDTWNHYRNLKTRTTNLVEGFYNALKVKAGEPHKNLFQFINLLKDQQEKFENKILLLDGGAPPKKPEPKYNILQRQNT